MTNIEAKLDKVWKKEASIVCSLNFITIYEISKSWAHVNMFHAKHVLIMDAVQHREVQHNNCVVSRADCTRRKGYYLLASCLEILLFLFWCSLYVLVRICGFVENLIVIEGFIWAYLDWSWTAADFRSVFPNKINIILLNKFMVMEYYFLLF